MKTLKIAAMLMALASPAANAAALQCDFELPNSRKLDHYVFEFSDNGTNAVGTYYGGYEDRGFTIVPEVTVQRTSLAYSIKMGLSYFFIDRLTGRVVTNEGSVGACHAVAVAPKM